MRAFYLTSQKEGTTLEVYLDEFNNQRDVVEQCGGGIGVHSGLTENALKEMNIDPNDANNYTTDDLKEAHQNAKEAYLAFVFLSNANKTKFAPLLRELANSYLRGNNNYPRTVTAAHKLLVGWEYGAYTLPSPPNEGISYITVGYESEEPDEEEGEVLVTAGDARGKISAIKRRRQEKGKTKKDAHLHLTTSNATNPHYNDNDADYDYGKWGSVTVDGLMFHQTGRTNSMCYRDAVLKSHKTPKCEEARIAGRWAAATEHLMQQTGTKGKINPNW
eukprot:11996285-Ditylum_brightwellii.AAC.1